MDRYIIREPRAGNECLQGNQIMAFPTSTGGNNMMPETFYTPYSSDFQNIPDNRYSLPPKTYPPNMMHGQAQIMSGIDPNYLATYSNTNAQYTAGHQHMYREMQMERQMQFRSDPAFGSDYQNRSLTNAERNNSKMLAQTLPSERPRYTEKEIPSWNNNSRSYEQKPMQPALEPPQKMPSLGPSEEPRYTEKEISSWNNNSRSYEQKPMLPALKPPQKMPPLGPSVAPKKPNETETPKNELQSQLLTRFDKLKALYKSGPRAFSGPVEKVLKWHKTLQDIGVLIIFEIIAKCVSIQPGSSCSKNLVVRDDNGPAMQVVYYEIDFLLPDLKLPSTVRVIGRMMPGTCRLQAFNVRPATGDDMATLSRRAAVASHHVAKLFKEYGPGEKI